MTTATASATNVSGLPHALKSAQEAMNLPDVQDMLRRLSEYKLGIFMPHMHDDRTGSFLPLPDDLTQVESGLEVSFQSTKDLAQKADRFLAVGWFWRAGESKPAAVCEMAWEETTGDAGRQVKHKMPKAK